MCCTRRTCARGAHQRSSSAGMRCTCARPPRRQCLHRSLRMHRRMPEPRPRRSSFQTRQGTDTSCSYKTGCPRSQHRRKLPRARTRKQAQHTATRTRCPSARTGQCSRSLTWSDRPNSATQSRVPQRGTAPHDSDQGPETGKTWCSRVVHGSRTPQRSHTTQGSFAHDQLVLLSAPRSQICGTSSCRGALPKQAV